ncbi:MAG: hypothetical protein ABIR18_01710 [Chitinophagaceae bacterium]
MKTYIQIDFVVQLIIVPLFVLYGIIVDRNILAMSYFIIGGWQILSCIIHEIFRNYYRSRQRNYYLWTLLFLVFAGMLCIPVMIYFGFALLIISPFLAIWYICICYLENKLIADKAWINLK